MTKKNRQSLSFTITTILLIMAVNSFQKSNVSGFISGFASSFLVFHFIGRFLLKKVLQKHDINK